MSEEKEDFAKRLNVLQDREREIIKKMNVAMRANANFALIEHMQFMLEEIRAEQFELKIHEREKNDGKDGFSDFLSIG